MKKLFISLALLTAVVAVHADKKEHIKRTREFLKKTPEKVDNLPISDSAKMTEHEHLVNEGKNIHHAMATSDDASSHEDRMSKVEGRVGEHAEAAQTLKRSGSLPGGKKGITTQD